MKKLGIIMERYHNFCEHYMYKALPEHHFYLVDNNYPFIGRTLPENAEIVPYPEIPWDKIDVGYAVTYERVLEVNKHGKPCVFHIDQVPQEWDNPRKLASLLNDNPVCYWSREEAEMWKVGTPVIRPHPIDTEIFKGYNPTQKKAITIATRAISGWGPYVKGYHILKDAYYQLPIQVIAKDDKNFPNAKEILSEEEMIKTLQDHQAYFNCAWKLDRSPLEAMACFIGNTEIDTFSDIYKVHKNDYEGDLIEIKTESTKIKCTPNHPILTNRGWKKAIDCDIIDSVYISKKINHDYKKSMESRRIKDIVNQLQKIHNRINEISSSKNKVVNSSKDKKNGVTEIKWRCINSIKNIIFKTGTFLFSRIYRWRRDNYFQSREKNQNKTFNSDFKHKQESDGLDSKQIELQTNRYVRKQEKIISKPQTLLFSWCKGIANYFITRSIISLSNCEKRAMWNIDYFYKIKNETKISRFIQSIRNWLLNRDKEIKQERIISIKKEFFKGKVYNLSTLDGVYKANGIIVHNCGMPVVAYKTQYNSYLEYFIDGENIIYADSVVDMINKTKELLENKEKCIEIGQKARETIIKYWDPKLSNEGWNKAFNLALK